MNHKALQKLERRIVRLEKAVFKDKSQRLKKKTAESFRGATGGIRFLLSQDFFNSKRTLAEVRTALAKNDYHYVNAVIQTALNRQSKPGGPLVTFKHGGKKTYVKRK